MPSQHSARMSNVAYWRPKKTKASATPTYQKPPLRVHWLVPKQPNRQQESCPTCLPAQRPECLTLRTWRPKKTSLCHTYLYCRNQLWESIGWFRNRRTAEESCPTCLASTAPRMSNIAYWRRKKTKLLPHLPIKNQLWESIGWLRKSRTTAGIVPNIEDPICEMLNAQKLQFPTEKLSSKIAIPKGHEKPICECSMLKKLQLPTEKNHAK